MFTFIVQDKVYVIIFFVIVIISIIYTIKLLRGNDKSSIKPSNPCLFSSDEKGAYGEKLIRSDLEKLSGKQKICSNVYLPKGNGETSEADIIFIHETGLYIIESKYYSGRIKVNEEYKEWTQYLGRRGINKFFNPILQNKTHIKCAKKLLESRGIKVDDKDICSVVIFGETSDLDKVICRDDLILDTEGSLYLKLRDRFKDKKKVFSENAITKIYNIFNEYCNVSEEIKNKHVQDVIRRRGR